MRGSIDAVTMPQIITVEYGGDSTDDLDVLIARCFVATTEDDSERSQSEQEDDGE